ncbi:SigB/SigF/SigG family RNA polymerase sigma factor [Streptomyces laculatispora]|uniref:SigB/SigF/SigG family RNA polymerase sigma factor n=1 Tax=Streptomyces laculatispora TaxID=887464 RepID=A0ABY9HZW8_9ACTN|nr:SigB/SigF/SigG family RNA polymerase sigma factor [Streptomyces laculatispora]WLQ39904.1 SigB/SigF/SigG family RNA polymerase sigma factor [Streptomyces laculatispora]
MAVNTSTSAAVDIAAALDLPAVGDPSQVAPKDARAVGRVFFDRLQHLEEGTHEYQYVRNSLIEMNLSLVQFAASRYKNRGGGDMEDIIQVGTIGLIKAIDRFELSREVEFTSFAIPYIVGEIKRFFRDTSWSVHVPRRLQELRVNLAKAREHLATELGRDAGVAELAQYMEISEDDVIEGLIASNGYTAGSLDLPMDSTDEGADQSSRNYADLIGGRDPGIELFEDLNTLAPLLREQLDDRERTLLRMRFGQEMTQSAIGEELGISQMHVSRLLNKTLAKLRTGMLTD